MKFLLILLLASVCVQSATLKISWDPVPGAWQYEILSQEIGSTNGFEMVVISIGQDNAKAVIEVTNATRFVVQTRSAAGVSPRSAVAVWNGFPTAAPKNVSVEVVPNAEAVQTPTLQRAAALQSVPAAATNWTRGPQPPSPFGPVNSVDPTEAEHNR